MQYQLYHRILILGCNYVPPSLLCMLALGKSGEGIYTQDCYITE